MPDDPRSSDHSRILEDFFRDHRHRDEPRRFFELETFLGRGSGQSFQLEFAGDGYVLVQRHEEVYMEEGS